MGQKLDIISVIEKARIWRIIPLAALALYVALDVYLPTTMTDPLVLLALLLVTAVLSPMPRLVDTRATRVILYMLMGFAVFFLIGRVFDSVSAYTGIEGLTPIGLLAVANAIVVLITVTDGYNHGYLFAGMGFAAVLFNLFLTGDLTYVGGKPDMLLVVGALWFLLPSLWGYSMAPAVNPTLDMRRHVMLTISTTLKSLPIFLLLSIVMALISWDIPLGLYMIDVVKANQAEVIRFLLINGWYYVLTHVIVVSAALQAYNVVMYAGNVKKEIKPDGKVVYSRKKPRVVKPEKKDPYEGLIQEMQRFHREFKKGNVNRIRATQRIGEFRSKYDMLTQQHKKGARDKARKVLQQIERDFEFTFKG